MSSPLLHWLCLGLLICLGPVDAPAGRPRVSMGGYDDDAPDRVVKLWKGSRMISWFNGSLQIDPPYRNTLRFDADTGVYFISCPRVNDSGHYTCNTTSKSSEYIVHIFGPGMENQSIPLGPFNESTMRAKLIEYKRGGPSIWAASYHKGSMSNDQSVSLQVNNGFLELEIHKAADRKSYRPEIMEERGSELYLIVNATLIIAPACEDPAIPADNRTLNETTERNTTKNWCKNEGPVHDSAKEGDLNGNAELQRNALSCNLERVTVQPGNAREEVPLLDNTQSLGTDKV